MTTSCAQQIDSTLSRSSEIDPKIEPFQKNDAVLASFCAAGFQMKSDIFTLTVN